MAIVRRLLSIAVSFGPEALIHSKCPKNGHYLFHYIDQVTVGSAHAKQLLATSSLEENTMLVFKDV